MVCSTKCSSISNMYHFCFIETGNQEINNNHVEQSSITNINSDTSDGYNILLYNGNDFLTYDNVSKNKIGYWSVLFCSYPNRSYVSYSSFENNTSFCGWGLIGFGNSKVSEMRACNVIGNFAANDQSGIIRTSAFSLNIIDTSMLENNKGAAMFDPETLGDTIFLFNCTIDNMKKASKSKGNINEKEPKSGWDSSLNKLMNNDCFSIGGLDSSVSKCMCKTVNAHGRYQIGDSVGINAKFLFLLI